MIDDAGAELKRMTNVSAFWLNLGIAAIAVACSKPAPGAVGEGAADAAAKQASDVVAGRDGAKKRLEIAIDAIGTVADGTPEQRRAAYAAAVKDVKASTDILNAASFEGVPIDQCTPLFDRLAVLADEEAKAAATEPEIPVKPEHDPPKYDGAFSLSGQIRTCYKDGVSLQVGSKFYFVSNAVCPDRNYLYGVVEPTGRTVNVDIGRDGREADVVDIADREKEHDDRAAYRKALAEYEAEYQKNLKEYLAATTGGNAAAVASALKVKAARKTERENIERQIERFLKPFAQARAKGSVGTFAQPAASALPESAGDAGAPTSIANQPGTTPLKTAETQPSTAAAGAAKRTTAVTGAAIDPEAKRRARGDCLRKCVAACNDDASCERACASTKCPSL